MTLVKTLKPVAASIAVLGGVYALGLIGVSLASRERVLGPEVPKAFCGFYLDCHRMVTLVEVERTDAIGDLRAAGTFHIVTLRLSSDAKRATLRTGRLRATVRDDEGRRFGRALDAERLLPQNAAVGLPDTAVAPGGAVLTRIVFDLPRGVAHPRLHVRDSHPIAVLTELALLGDEDSLLHARTTFALSDATEVGRGPGRGDGIARAIRP